jgi:hypothetical protein
VSAAWGLVSTDTAGQGTRLHRRCPSRAPARFGSGAPLALQSNGSMAQGGDPDRHRRPAQEPCRMTAAACMHVGGAYRQHRLRGLPVCRLLQATRHRVTTESASVHVRDADALMRRRRSVSQPCGTLGTSDESRRAVYPGSNPGGMTQQGWARGVCSGWAYRPDQALHRVRNRNGRRPIESPRNSNCTDHCRKPAKRRAFGLSGPLFRGQAGGVPGGSPGFVGRISLCVPMHATERRRRRDAARPQPRHPGCHGIPEPGPRAGQRRRRPPRSERQQPPTSELRP